MSAVHVFLVLSNLAFLLPAVKSVQLHRWTRAFIYVLMIIASSMYHACNSFANACVFDPNTSRKLDFFFAQWIVVYTALYLIKFPPKWAFIERWLIIAFGVGIFVAEVFTDEPFLLQGIIAALAAFMIIVYWIVFAVEEQRCFVELGKGKGARLPRYDWSVLAQGFIITGLACTLFATQKRSHILYPYVHMIWHILAALAQYWILCCRDAAPRNAAIDGPLIWNSLKSSKRGRGEK